MAAQAAIVETIAKAVASVTNSISNFLGIRAQTDAAVEMNRDSELSRTNRNFANNAMMSSVLPVAIIGIILFIIFSKQKK